MEFPVYLLYNNRTYSIEGYISNTTNFIDNKGYIDKDTGRIYICAKNNEPLHNDVPILFVKEDPENEGSFLLTKKDTNYESSMNAFHESNLRSLSYDYMEKNTNEDDVLYNEEALQDMNAATSMFIPVINEDDDVLKKLIKTAIIEKRIDITRLKHKMPQKYGLTNMKSALIGKTKMSISNFVIWCELLELDFEVSVIDNGRDTQNPLRKQLYYSSVNNKLDII